MGQALLVISQKGFGVVGVTNGAGDLAGVVLAGRVGTGKTHLLTSLAQAYSREEEGHWNEEAENTWTATQERRDVEYWPILDLVSELRAEMKTDERWISERCRTCDLLILDDFGQERVTDFVLEEIERIIDWRYRDMLPLAIGTNLTIKQIQEKYGDRMISRWVSQCEIVKMIGPDYRKKKHGLEKE